MPTEPIETPTVPSDAAKPVGVLTVAEMAAQLETQRDGLKAALANEVSKERQANENARKLRVELRDTERLLKAAKPQKKAAK